MRVFYTASYTGKQTYQKQLDLVRRVIKQKEVELLSPEEGNYLSILKNKDFKDLKSKQKVHYEAIKQGINWAQAVIIELSHEDFQLGHEATLAIQAKKPVLCLSIHRDFSGKIQSPYFFGAKYNEYNIEEIIDTFIKTAETEALSIRFNLFISPRQETYLNHASKKAGMNKSEYLRMLIDRDQK